MTELQPGATTGAVESCNRRCGCCMGLGDDEDDRRGWGQTKRGWRGMGTGDEEDRRGPATRTATGGDKRRGAALLERGMWIQPECSRKKKPGAIRFFLPGSNDPRGSHPTDGARPAETFGRRTGAYQRP